MRQSTLGESQYHAAIFKFEKRMSNGWGGRINYTYSQLKDNQFGETNFFSTTPAEMQDAYNLDYEYGIGLLDVPHKIVMSPIVELPFGEGKKWLNDGIGNVLLGDWTLSSIISIESGFPTAYNTGHRLGDLRAHPLPEPGWRQSGDRRHPLRAHRAAVGHRLRHRRLRHRRVAGYGRLRAAGHLRAGHRAPHQR